MSSGSKHDGTRILILAKTPLAGKVKTRLIPALGEQGACRLHESMINHSLEMASSELRGAVELWCTPTTQHPFLIEAARRYGAALYTQVGDDLGARMHRAVVSALERARAAVLIGCDCPEYTSAYLAQAVAALSRVEVVLGPARDGGYALVGMRSPHPELFCEMPWGRDDVMAETLRRLRRDRVQFFLLPEVADIDRPEDLRGLAGDARFAHIGSLLLDKADRAR